MVKKVVLGLLCLCFMSSSAATYITGEVKRIYPISDKVHFRIKGDTCLSGSKYYYFKMTGTTTYSEQDAKNWYSMLLASAMAGKPVSVKVNSCPADAGVEIKYLYQDY